MNNTARRVALGNAIRECRENQGISQRKLALMMGGDSHSYLVEIENGTKSVGFDKLCAIADALDVSVGYFFTRV